MNRILKFSLIFVLLSHALLGQPHYTTSSKKAIRYFETALQDYQKMEYAEAITDLKEALRNDEKFSEAWLLMADIYSETGDKQQVIESLDNALKWNPDLFPPAWFNLGKNCFSVGNYVKARQSLGKFITYPVQNASFTKKAAFLLQCCDFAIHAMEHPVPFNPVNLGDSINTSLDEYWPSLSADEQSLVYTVLVARDPDRPVGPGNQQEDFYCSLFHINHWAKGKNMGKPLNTPDNEGAQTLTPDGRTMYFTACNRPDGRGQCDIYMSKRTADGWTLPVNLGDPVNTAASEKQPSISPDGNTLYFVSSRPGGLGGLDIWSSSRKEDGTWENPIDLGDSINTPANEQSPFIHSDNVTLYFSSDGRIGMGGFDIYMSRKKKDGHWSKAENLGYPINTWKDETGLIVNAEGDQAYFASNRELGKGNDIYRFDLYPGARPTSVSYMKGKVRDAESGKPLDAHFQLIDIQTGDLISEAASDRRSGEFLAILPFGHEFALNVSRSGYLFYSDHLILTDTFSRSKPYLVDILLNPIKKGEKVILKNIFFETDSWKLKEESMVEIGKLLDFMRDNQDVVIEISGHTDNTGTTKHNLTLSQNRAGIVGEYITSHGIPASRIVTVGYGESQPIAPNDTDAGRALNRRTEFKILSGK